MKLIKPSEAKKHYDVVIVGGGISGALVAKQLSRAGKSCLILEGGEATGSDYGGYQEFLNTYYKETAKIPDAPYPVNPNAPEPTVLDVEKMPPTPSTKGYFVQYGPLPFRSSYTTYLGGTTLHWLGTSLRMLPEDFKVKTLFGVGEDWPISYEDMQPWYEKAEFELGVSANVEEQSYLGVQFPKGYVYPMHGMPRSYVDQTLSKSVDGMQVKISGASVSLKVRGTPASRNGIPNERYDHGKGYVPRGAVGDPAIGQRCMGNSSCVPICPVQAKYNALKTLNEADENHLSIQPKSVAYKLDIDPKSKRVTGIRYKHYTSMHSPHYTEHVAHGTLYVLAGHAVPNAILLLASDAANQSDMVGRNLMDHPELLTWGLMPEKVWPMRGPLATSGIEDLRGGRFRSSHAAFRLEMGNDGWGWPAGAPASNLIDYVDTQKLYGPKLRQTLNDEVTRQFRFGILVEQLPEASNRVTIDPKYRDAIGNFRPVIHYNLSDYTRAGFYNAYKVSQQIFRQAGIKDYSSYPESDPGYFTYNGEGLVFNGAGHFAGTHRMGSSPKTSVVNPQQRCWDHDNLYLVGCGNMVTLGTSNPTLTMAALSLWAAQNMIDDLERNHP
ncbi:GMC family oxidoreductase [Parachitinimonas caeni]|uniref:GMC family oxidoreductase n=1 Tax=Parachitinimonas caeni TaxID=3031301 RepID=A0ABT7DWC5_9NEIS|nr:GMC family oxidoreductase [Parachitinimonas caeni]MDK2124371.1 GMC family oxidoreductase [Parachitinimonas caeni]